uniref:hypothetical protein n=1 Tax=Crocinitomix algicola TaxID=1740263 RepID=UPI001C30B2A5
GIDDDGDALIDLNDEDCDCDDLTGFTSLIPNPSFEDTLCCPISVAALFCTESWIQASDATSDYLHYSCGLDYLAGIPPEYPLPEGGDAYVGFINMTGNHEMVGVCIDGPLLSGVNYNLTLYTAWAGAHNELDLTLYGTPNCGDLPWDGYECPIGFGDWEVLSSVDVVYEMDGSWQEVTFSFTPDVDINAIAIGGACGDAESG